MRSLLPLLGCVPSYPALWTTFARSGLPLTTFDASCSPLWPPGALSRPGASISSARLFLMLLGSSCVRWKSPGTAVSAPGSSGSSRGLLGEFISSLDSERFLTRFNALCRFFGLFPTSSTVLCTGDASASSLGPLGSILAPSGEFFSSSCSELSRSCSDVFLAFFSQFLASSSHLDAPGASASSVVSSSSKLD